MKDYDDLISTSANCDRFEIVYEFTDSSDRVIEKVLSSLNIVRETDLVNS